MITLVRTLNKEYFRSIEINVNVDDLVILESDSDDVKIKVNISNNMTEDIMEHFTNSDRYEPNLNIVEGVLFINYYKESMILLCEEVFVEVIGFIISIPKNIPYKIINYENEDK